MSIKNKIVFLVILICILFNTNTIAEELDISASEVIIDKDNEFIVATGSVVVTDTLNNKVTAEKVEYNKAIDQVTTYENSKLILKNGYEVSSGGMVYDNKNKLIFSKNKSTIIDPEGNLIYVDMFEYLVNKNLFSSVGNIKIIDINKNKYSFEEMHIDTKEKKIVGSNIRLSLNEKEVGLNKDNDPRLVANSAFISEEKSDFINSVFTTCKKRGGKCPPWALQSKKISHDKAKKTIYYENAVLKIYDIPLFFFPKFFHPDPSVKRQSGFLIPFLTDKTTVGTGFALPYFWAMGEDRDITFTPKIYTNHKSLLLGEYRQAFENSFLHLDASFSEGYNDVAKNQTGGSRNHIFGKFDLNLSDDPSYESDFSIQLQKVSNDTYLKVHDIKTGLVDKNTNLKSEIKYDFNKDESFFNISGSVYQDLNESSNKSYEYFLPNINFGKLLFSTPELGSLNFKSRAYYNNYDVNKQNTFLINDFIWNSKNFITKGGFINSYEAQVKNTNYESQKDTKYKSEERSNEISGLFAFNTKLPMIKESGNYKNIFSPTFMLRLAPGHMRDLRDEQISLSYSNLFSSSKTSQPDVIENGYSGVLGFDFSVNKKTEDGEKNKLNLSLGQVFSPEENKDLSSKSSLDQKASDLVGEVNYNFSEKNNISYIFTLDHNLSDLNYNEVSSNFSFGKIDFNLDYLEERNHVGNENYIQTGIALNINESSSLKFETKKNYKTESTEFYNLSYQYQNDCLSAGLTFNRNFYADRDIEASDTLMFRISIIPFGGISSPSLLKE